MEEEGGGDYLHLCDLRKIARSETRCVFVCVS